MNIDRQKIYQVDDYKFVNFVMLDEETIENIRIWRNHPDIRKRMYSEDEIPKESHHRFVRSLNNCDTKYYWLVYRGNEPVGTINLVDIDTANNNGQIGFYLIPDYLSHGVGLEFMCIIHHFFFRVLQVGTLFSETAVDNFDILIASAYLGFTIDYTPTLINSKSFYSLTCTSDQFPESYKSLNNLKNYVKFGIKYKQMQKQRKLL